MTATQQHVPVLLEPALEALNIASAGRVVDATYGRGGHSRAMLSRLRPDGRLIVIDQDPEAIAHARESLGSDPRVTVWHGNFAELERMARELDVYGRVDALLLDVGVSSPQLDSPKRGFSFRDDGPLDMRMNPDAGESAAEWLARAEEAEIARVIFEYGEDRYARRIARSIVMARADEPIERTAELAAIVARAAGPSPADRHPATRTFQAIRIHINDELGALDRALEQGVAILSEGGRMAVISFHSLEDRRVKQAFRALSSPPPASRRIPVAPDFTPVVRLVGKMIKPSRDEIRANPRSRSSRLRVVEKMSGDKTRGVAT